MAKSKPAGRSARWPSLTSGPTATVAQRARRRLHHAPTARALVFSPRPPAGPLASALAEAGLQVDWTDSGPGAVGEAVGGDLAVCVVDVGGPDGRELDYLPCLNQADPLLPVIVVNDCDSLQTQRKVRSHKVFYYLLQPLLLDEVREVLTAALRAGAAALT